MTNKQKSWFSLASLTFIAIVVFALSSALVVTSLVGVRTSAEGAVVSWRQYADQASAQQRGLRQFVTQAGVGAMIQEYYRFASSGDEAVLPMLYGRGGAALAALAIYPAVDVSPEEVAALGTLQRHTRVFLLQVARIGAMHAQGRPKNEILQAADVDGKAAASALRVLATAAAASMVSDNAPADSKALILLDVRRFMGLEGLVHNANRYLNDPRPELLEQVRANRRDVSLALERYRQHVLAPDEASALERLWTGVSGIEQRLAIARETGASLLDDRALQAGVTQLEQFAYAEGLLAQQNLERTLAEVSGKAVTLTLVVGTGAVLLVCGGVWLLWFRIGRRVRSITTAMGELARGKLDIDIPGERDGDEIGEMSKALSVFRDGLRANATLASELTESSRLASLGALVAGISHELNTPIGNALAVSSTLEDQCRTFRKDLGAERIMRSTLDRHAATLEEAANLIQRNLSRAAEQISAFKQVAVDQTSGRRREFHLDDVLGNVVQSMQPLFKRTSFSLRLGPASGAVLDSYPGALSQVVTNLIENGLKHGLAGRPSGQVEISVRRLGPHFTEIVVTDDGWGMADDVKPSIFQAFFTTKASKGGSGLGLHIVKSIVSGPLAGQISVESEPGRGSRFIVTLPNKTPADTSGAKAPEHADHATAQRAA